MFADLTPVLPEDQVLNSPANLVSSESPEILKNGLNKIAGFTNITLETKGERAVGASPHHPQWLSPNDGS